MKNYVLYTDGGSFRGNPAPIGYGVHGYLYDYAIKPNRLGIPSTKPTNLGYTPSKEAISYEKLDDSIEPSNCKDPIEVDVLKIVNLIGSYGTIQDNNEAEILALQTAIDYLLTEEADGDILIYTDSKVAISAIKRSIKGKPIEKYKDLAEKLYQSYLSLQEKVKSINIEWIKGHSGDIGNTQADLLATMGASLSYSYLKGLREDAPLLNVPTDLNYFRKDEVIHPLLCTTRMFFNPNRDRKDGTYYLGEIGESDDRDVGKESSSSCLAIVKLNKPNEVLEIVKEEQFKWLENRGEPTDVVIVTNLSNISNSANYNYIRTFKELFIKAPHSKDFNPDLCDCLKNRYTTVMRPAYLSGRLSSQYDLLGMRLEQYLGFHTPDDLIDIDITPMLYDTKKKFTLKKEVDNLVKALTVYIPKGDKSYPHAFSLGIDLPNRNTLKRLESYHPQVSLIVYRVEGNLYASDTLITLKTGEYGIFTSPYGGTFFLI